MKSKTLIACPARLLGMLVLSLLIKRSGAWLWLDLKDQH